MRLAHVGQRGADAQGLGRSRGGLSTKIHAAGDALGLPVRLIAGPGQHSDIACAAELIEGFAPDAVLGDKPVSSLSRGATTQTICARPSKRPAPPSSFHPNGTASLHDPVIATSTRNETRSNASSTSSSSSAASPPDMTSCSSTSWASSNWPPSQYGSDS